MKEPYRDPALESVRRRDRNRSLRQRRRDERASDRLRALSSFVSAETDQEVVLERNDDYWGEKAKLARVRFAVVPDATTRGSRTAQRQRRHRHQLAHARHRLTLRTRSESCRRCAAPGTVLAYHGIQPARSDSERCARAAGDCLCARSAADDRIPVARTGAAGRAAFCRRRVGPTTAMCPPTITIPRRAHSCSMPPDIRPSMACAFIITMKTSTDENTRLMVAVMQQQLREVGIALDIRSFEFATFFCRCQPRSLSDVLAALDRRQRRSRHLRICVPLLASFRPTEPTAASIPIRKWTR